MDLRNSNARPVRQAGKADDSVVRRRRTSSQVGDAPHVQAAGQLVQRLPTGCEETAEQPMCVKYATR
jgi:hypothetical protein